MSKRVWKLTEIKDAIKLYKSGKGETASIKYNCTLQAIRRIVQRYDPDYERTRRSPKFGEQEFLLTSYLIKKGLTFGQAAKVVDGSSSLRKNYFRMAEKKGFLAIDKSEINTSTKIKSDFYLAISPQLKEVE